MAAADFDEPNDLFCLRISAHELTAIAYRYLRRVLDLADAGEDPEFEQFKGVPLDGPLKTGADYLKQGLDDPHTLLECLVRSFVAHINDLMDAHGKFQQLLEPVADELADVYPGLQNICGFECRSHSKALETFAFHLVRSTFDALNRYTPESEIDERLGEGDQQPFTASNWYPTCVAVAERFRASDVEDRVHEAIEQEIADAWKLRMAQVGDAVVQTGESREASREKQKMFNLLVANDGMAWETDQLMRIRADRFNNEYCGTESQNISLDNAQSLRRLEGIDSLLMYETGTRGPNPDVVRYGHVHEIRRSGSDVTFRFDERGRLTRSIVEQFTSHLGLKEWELGTTHWAVKDGGIPSAVLKKIIPIYDIVLSFAGENRDYVERVATYLRTNGVRLFYDRDEEADLWGKDLAEHLDSVYRNGRFCLMFISRHYAEKVWPNHERKSALVGAIQRDSEYILPARFDDTELPGIRPTVGHIDLTKKDPDEVGGLVLAKLRRDSRQHGW